MQAVLRELEIFHSFHVTERRKNVPNAIYMNRNECAG